MLFVEILKILFWVFCLFGLFISIRMLCGYFLLKHGSYMKAETILFLKNDEETIENTIRIMAEEIFFTAREKVVPTLTIVDMGSDDSSTDIVKLLKREYPFLRLVSKEEYIDEINKF